MSRARPAGMGGAPPINPIDIVTMTGVMGWPAEPGEAVHVLTAMDDEWRAMQRKD